MPRRRKLVAPGKPILLAPLRPNAGVEAAYRRKLERLVEEMHASIAYWVRAAYRADDSGMAADRSLASAMNAVVKRLTAHWERKFDRLSKGMADYFATSVSKRTDATLKAHLKEAGFAVEFDLSAGQRNTLQAVVNENVSLIRSIASEHMTQVQGIVMRGVSEGRNLSVISKGLQEQFGVTSRRATLIARDQANKATSVLEKQRQQELGVTQAIWKHSTAGKHPRPSHVAANGKKYDVAKGMYLDGVWTWPGREINCRCYCRSIIPGIHS
jgi:SPP1 gp7 family putative phage head morphogenesis protein